MRLELRYFYLQGNCPTSTHRASSWIQDQQKLCILIKPNLGRAHLYENPCPLIPITCDFPRCSTFLLSHFSQPSNDNFFPLKCHHACEHSPVGTSKFRTNPFWTRKEIQGTLLLPEEKFYGISPKCIISMWLYFLKLLWRHFISVLLFLSLVGLLLLFFCNRDFIFKY